MQSQPFMGALAAKLCVEMPDRPASNPVLCHYPKPWPIPNSVVSQVLVSYLQRLANEEESAAEMKYVDISVASTASTGKQGKTQGGDLFQQVRPALKTSTPPADGAAGSQKSSPTERVLFLQENLRQIGNGIEVAGIRRAHLFHGQLGITPWILTSNFSPRLRENEASLKDKGMLPSETKVLNVYEWLVDMSSQGLLTPLASSRPSRSPGSSSSASAAKPSLRKVSHPAAWDSTQVGCEEFGLANGQILMRKTFKSGRSGADLQAIELRDAQGTAVTHATESDFVCAMMAANLEEDVTWHFLVDKNKMYRKLRQSTASRRFRHTVSAFLHSTHRLPNGQLKTSYRHLFEDADSCDSLIVATEEQHRDLLETGMPATKLKVIPHALPGVPEIVESASLQEKRVIYLARYTPEKQHELLFQVFERVLKRVPDAQLHTHGVGPLQATLQARVDASGLAGSIHIHGYANDVATLFKESSLGVMASNEEGFSLFGLECLAHARPLVAFSVKYGPKDLLEGRNAGILIPPGHVDAMADAIVALLEDPEKAYDLRFGALTSAERFTADKVAQRWSKWWADVREIARHREANTLTDASF
ncbi:glycosyltransferase [Variovorax boronicumulans]|uniref:glycosyltransferase n=1 Tax=Variovorax boronicumulans TaxID=436515 RepID=UPI001330F01A|nr:glycosyltransferase [Variovorax boronicumulans]